MIIGTVKGYRKFPHLSKYRCIIHDTTSDVPCKPCQIYSAISDDYHADINAITARLSE